MGALEAEVVGTRDVDGVVRPFVSWTSLLPLYAGIPSAARARRMVETLLRPGAVLGALGRPDLPRRLPLLPAGAPGPGLRLEEAPRGPGLQLERPGVGALQRLPRRWAWPGTGYDGEARTLAERTVRLLVDDLDRTGMLHECWNDAGVGLWPRSGTFVSWNVLGPWLLDHQTCEGPGPL